MHTAEQMEVFNRLAGGYGAVRVDRVPPMGALKFRASVKDSRGMIVRSMDVYPDGSTREHKEFCPECAAPPEIPHAEACRCAAQAS